MIRRTLAVLAAALIAGGLGLIASIRLNGPGPLLRTELGRGLVELVGGNRPPAGLEPVRMREAVGPLSLSDLSGQPQQLPRTRGHRVLINIWASWCVPCREEMPILAKFAADQGPNGVQVVGIAQDNPAAVRAYLRAIPVNYPILLDNPLGHAGIQLGDRLGLLPYSVLLDGEGRLLRRNYGPFANTAVLSAWVSRPE
jgi:thiol-disulfide isomerase/thioredoxin